jgi:hypothetical protein
MVAENCEKLGPAKLGAVRERSRTVREFIRFVCPYFANEFVNSTDEIIREIISRTSLFVETNEHEPPGLSGGGPAGACVLQI